ncbi:MAG: NADH-quinone oxidoreductase subunit N [Chrysiogenetes bacterium]|nr:NADH-quinone oxidoreductase subunit N [Chrysiogenetes bacterium]
MPELNINFHYVLPPLLMALGGCVVLTEGLVLGARKHTLFFVTTLITAAASLGASLCLRGEVGAGFSDAVIIDGTVVLLLSLVAICVILGALVSPAYLNRYKMKGADYYTLMLFAACGMQVLVSAGDLSTLFIGLETMSVSVYALTGYRIRQDASTEGAMKYFLLGAFATGFLLYGMAFLYGATGTTNLAEMGLRLGDITEGSHTALFAMLGLGLLLVGMAFKVGAFPFHMWVPDAYQGAPTPVTAFMSVAVKAAAFGILLRTLSVALFPLAYLWQPLISWLAVGTMLAGNVLALRQDNVKRMLAYSSVSHAGYLLLGVAASGTLPTEAGAAVIHYLMVYAFMNVGAFAVLLSLSREGYERTRYSDLTGLSQERPLIAAVLAFFMIALAGIPPTGGFTAKFYLFAAAIKSGLAGPAILGILSSVIGVVYYLRVVVVSYMNPRDESAPIPAVAPRGIALSAVIVIALLVTLEMGLNLLPGLGWFIPGYLEEFSHAIAAAF